MSLCYFFFILWTTPYNNLHWLTSFFTGLKIKAKQKSYYWTSNKQPSIKKPPSIYNQFELRYKQDIIFIN